MTKRCRKEGRCPPGRILTSRPQTSGLEVAPSGAKAPKPRSSLLQRATGEGPITDAEGLARAYQQGDAYTHGSTTYVAGSHTARDWYDDVTKVPFWGDTRESHRYKMADRALKANPQVTRAVGHSLGGAVALEAQKQHPGLESRTYGAPVFSPLGRESKAERYRNLGDPVSILDRSAKKSIHWRPFSSLSEPHDYSNMAVNHTREGQAATENPDHTAGITE